MIDKQTNRPTWWCILDEDPALAAIKRTVVYFAIVAILAAAGMLGMFSASGCIKVERVQVGPDKWPQLHGVTTDSVQSRPADDVQTPQEIIDELFGDIETDR